MEQGSIDKINALLDNIPITSANKKEINEAKKAISKHDFVKALSIIKSLNSKKETEEEIPKIVYNPTSEDDIDYYLPMDIEEDDEDEEEEEDLQLPGFDVEEETEENESSKSSATKENNKKDEEENNEDEEEIDEDDYGEFEEYDDDIEEPHYVEDTHVYTFETEKDKERYPKELSNIELEKIYIGLLLQEPRLIVRYYILFEDCYFQSEALLNIYKSILFTEGGDYTPEIAKRNFNFAREIEGIYQQKYQLRKAVENKGYNMETIYTDLKKLCILRRKYTEMPIETIQEKIVEIANYELYDKMTVEEVESATNQVTVTDRFKQSVLNIDLTSFLEKGENNLTNGLSLPFPILTTVFKGIRKGETMAIAMPSNAGKSRFTVNLATYTALIHKKKVLIISNEMSEEKMRLTLITTILNHPDIQKLHGQKLSITEGELLEFKFRPDSGVKVEVDEQGYVKQKPKETREQFVNRLLKISTDFKKTIKVTDWINKQVNNSVYFINITDHTNDELKKVIMNYYYKEKIEYIFYDTLKTDTANIGNGEEIKRTATILSNLAQNFGIFICSTLQLTENKTNPINLDINDLAVSRTVKEVLDTLCLVKQIPREMYDDFQYSEKEVDTKFYNLKKYKDPDERYYACVVDKNRAGAKPKLLFNLNLAYNRWIELGYLSLKQGE